MSVPVLVSISVFKSTSYVHVQAHFHCHIYFHVHATWTWTWTLTWTWTDRDTYLETDTDITWESDMDENMNINLNKNMKTDIFNRKNLILDIGLFCCRNKWSLVWSKVLRNRVKTPYFGCQISLHNFQYWCPSTQTTSYIIEPSKNNQSFSVRDGHSANEFHKSPFH